MSIAKSKYKLLRNSLIEFSSDSTLEEDDAILPKSVSWAEHNEERIIENREMMANPQKYKSKIGKLLMTQKSPVFSCIVSYISAETYYNK